MSWIVEFKSKTMFYDATEVWFREVPHEYTAGEEAQVKMVQCIFEDPDYEFRVREIKESTNDQPG